MPSLTLPSPIGALTVAEAGGAIVRLSWAAPDVPAGGDETPLLLTAAQQLDAYFYCELGAFDLPLAPAGSPFQQAVWTAMRAIPRGATQSYGALARALRTAAQPVGTACGENPIPILIPCHRVIAADGGLGGYSGAGGVATKRWLLEHEGAAAAAQGDLFGAGG